MSPCQTNTVTIFHVTSVDAAVAIAHSRIYLPVSNHPLHGDAGLNAFHASQPVVLDQNFSGTGARLIFEWDGPIATESAVPLSPNVLHLHGAFRVIVPIGTVKHLKLVGFEADAGAWNDYNIKLPWYGLMPGLRHIARRAALFGLREEIDAIVSKQPTIRVGA